MPQQQNVIAIVYDYDRTLSPFSMQDDVLFARLGVARNDFWGKAADMIASKAYEGELAWMRLLLEIPEFRRMSNKDLSALGKELHFYRGVPEVFRELSLTLNEERFQQHGIKLEHYVVTSGLQAILDGSGLKRNVDRIFGCELDEDKDGRVCWPKRIVSHTSKTQYLFRINKGVEYMDFHLDVNDHLPEDEKRVPFSNMMYIGDGPTDVPCFAVVTSLGGKAVAVYDPDSKNAFENCMSLRDAKRVDEIAEADYRKNTHLRRVLEYYVKQMALNIVARMEGEHVSRLIQAPRHY
ncbi:MAG: haloacid dehalogenase-like hydrolase [SAR202 cluster bacterium]|nr:haloacid dehalogenase-like hydrolase [SAR202 cluster bacterium]